MSGFQMPITIGDAMYNIEHHYYVLPAFQREFVWKAEQIEKLFDSLMRGFPTNSMLFWKVKGDTKTQWNFYNFIDSFVKDARGYSIDNPLYASVAANDFFAILDGQQRLTAMRIGLYGSYAYHERNKSWDYAPSSFPRRHLYLCLSKTAPDVDCEYIFKFQKDDITHQEDLFRDSNQDLWFKVGSIVTIHNSTEDILDYAQNNKLSKENRKILKRLEQMIFEDKAITYYEEDEQNPDKAVNIFTRINSGGTTLDFSDIVFSLMVANWTLDAKNEIKSLIEAVSQKGFEINKDYIIKAFLYLYHKNIKTEIKSFSKDFCSKIEANWDNIKECILSMFELFRIYGLSSFTLTSNNATLPILYYLYHKKIYTHYVNSVKYKEERKVVKKWLLSMIVRRTFGGQSDSILSQTRKTFTDNIDISFIPDDMSFPAKELSDNIKNLHPIDDEFLEELLLQQKDGRYAFTILALLYPHLDYKNNNFHKDHLHPESAYKQLSKEMQEKYPFRIYNSILNLQMLDANENESKSNKSLKDWVNGETSPETRAFFLKNHLIPDVDLSIENFDAYIVARKSMLKQELKNLLD